MHAPHAFLRNLLLAGTAIIACAGTASFAADVTPDRLVNADKEPRNWLMNHRTYDAQRYSPLDKINKANVKGLKLAYAVAIGGTSANENLESTPLAEDGFLYVVDQWGVLYKIDGRSGDVGRIVWRMDPGQEKMPLANRGAALWGNFVVTVANYPARVDRHQQGDRQGRLGDQSRRRSGRPAAHRGAARRQGQDHHRRRRRRPRRARFHRRARCRDRQGGVAQIHRAGARRARLGDLEGQEQRLADRRRRHVGHRLLRSRHQPGAVGHRQSGADVQSVLPSRATISTPTA